MFSDGSNLMFVGTLGDKEATVKPPPNFLKNTINRKVVVSRQNMETQNDIEMEGPPRQVDLAKLMRASYQSSIDRSRYLDQAGAGLPREPDMIILPAKRKPTKKKAVSKVASRSSVGSKRQSQKKKKVKKTKKPDKESDNCLF